MESSKGSSSKTDRKTVEKRRRDEMKALYSNLTALVPGKSPNETKPIPNQLDEATNYITKLQAKLEELKQKKGELTGGSSSSSSGIPAANEGLKLPDIQISMTGSVMHVTLTTGVHYRSMFKQVVGILNQEGAEVVYASFSVVDQTIFHTIQAQLTDWNASFGRVSERLKNFVYGIGCN